MYPPFTRSASHVRNGPRNAPWAQRLDLGWVVIGNACLDSAHVPDNISTCSTNILLNGRPSHFQPCPNHFHLKNSPVSGNNSQKKENFVNGKFMDGLGTNIFTTTKEDDKLGTSIEDRKFISIMEHGMTKNSVGNWIAPLPFREEITQLPNGRELAVRRLKSTIRNLERKPEMKKHYFTFMQSLLDHGHAEVVPLDEVATTKPGWYLPHFGVYNPQKPNKVRVVYDAAAECGGVSLNSLLLPGPDLTNSLIGILLRFRESPVAFMADVEQMFYSFSVQENHRNYLKFLWYQDNNPGKDIVEYRMKVHIFGSTSSPAVATYGLRKTAEVEKANFGPDAADLVNRNFYVDDALKSVPTVEDAVDLLHRTQSMLSTANLRLHKIASNRQEVMEAFPSEDQASDLRDLDLSKDAVPVQRSLGVYWDLKTDDFTFKVSTEVEEKPFTRRGVLSVVNSLYDPLGLVAPVVIRGKAILRAMTSNLKPQDWDEPLPKEYKKAWEAWRSSLDGLTDLKVQRSYTSKALTTATRKEIHTFGDASSDSIAAVSYLRVVWPNGHVDVSFILGKAKLAPTRATTIPRLELCAAVLATEITLLITEELDVCPDSVTYYTDSRVVLGYF
ncbi:hypothetical protein QZH41_004965 [Actinostola sp. cb2023]|nr:hypothetical protein QZH41_004965 [Actinostola sp. cb2023]